MKTPGSLRLTVRLGFLLALGTAGSALAFTFLFQSTTGLTMKWPAGPIPIRIMLGDTQVLGDGSNYNTSTRAAAEAWNTHLGSVQFTTTFSSDAPGERNGLNEVFFSSTYYGREFPNAVAIAPYWRIGTRKTESDIIFNTKYKFDSYKGPLRSRDGEWLFDIHRIMLHELGHTLGLDHPADAGQVVTAKMNGGAHDLDSLMPDDIAGAQSLYGPPGVPSNDAFAAATPITFSGETTTVTGYNTNATKETGEPLNTLDPGGRSVWWRWTAPASERLILNTTGSYFDTMVVVYAGTALTALEPIVASYDNTTDNLLTSLLTFNATAGRVYHFKIDGEEADSGSIVLNLRRTADVGTAPSIVVHPVSVTVNAGASATFSVGADGTHPFTFQWRREGIAIDGATTALMTLSGVTTSVAGNYTVTVTNPAGSVTSNAATLTVNAPPPPPSPAPSSGGGGGGGAPSAWFCAAIAALTTVRLLRRHARP